MLRATIAGAALAALLLCGGCVVRPVPIEATVYPHTWTYYPDHDVFYCRHHRCYWVYDGSRWVERPRLGVALGPGFHLSYHGARPFHMRRPWRYRAHHLRAGFHRRGRRGPRDRDRDHDRR